MAKTATCPECGCIATINDNLLGEGFRECLFCHQEWWADIDYGVTDVA